MSAFLQTIRSLDLSIYYFLNRFAGNRVVDYVASFEENSNLLKGGVFLATYWYLWFAAAADQKRRRRAIIAVMVGAMLSLVASRMIANVAPYRIRPMYDVRLQHHPYSFPISPNLVNWSAFPSDTATFFFALASGLAYVSRRLTVPAMLYVALWICLPRLFLGVHYASDIVAGAVIGITLVWTSLNIGWLQSRLASRVLALADAKPEVFYVAAFLVSFEMGVLFDDVRLSASTLFRIVQPSPFHAVIAACAIVGSLAISVSLFIVSRNRRISYNAAERNSPTSTR